MFRRVLSTFLSLVFLLQILSGCASKKTDDEIYLSKGEFFSYYVYENGLSSEKYTTEDIQNCQDGSVEADILLEWGYITEEQAKKGLRKNVDRETVVAVCANGTFGLKNGDPSQIKDAELLFDSQLIANAYESGICDLDNGYFDGAEKMSFSDCEEIINNANEYEANFHYEPNTWITETAEDVIEQDSSNYKDGDIVLEFFGDEEQDNSDNDTAEINNNGGIIVIDDNAEGNTTKKGYKTVNTATTKKTAVPTYSGGLHYQQGFGNSKGFRAIIKKEVFERDLKNPKIGDTVVFNRSQLFISSELMIYGEGEYIGTLISKDNGVNIACYECIFEILKFEPAVQKKNVEEGNGCGIDTKSFVKETEEVAGWKLKFDVSSGAVKINAKKDFTVYETGRKQDWQNAKKTVTAVADFELSDFNLDVNNLKSFATKRGSGFVKITCDTEMKVSLEQSLRYTPDSNRNGKFPSNWNSSRWTDKDAKGAKSIKIAKFSPSLYGMVGIEVYIYMQISADGKISFTTSIDDGGVKLSVDGGKIACKQLGKKEQSIEINVNLRGRLGVTASLTIFSFINVVTYDVGANVNIHALANVYYEDVARSGVYADEEGLDEYEKEDGKFDYCIGASIELSISGKLQDSGVKLILDYVAKDDLLNFEKTVWTGGFHFENGKYVEKCTHGDDLSEELKESENDSVELSKYKVNMVVGESEVIPLTAVPSRVMSLISSKNAIKVKSDRDDVCTVKYDRDKKIVIIDGIGEGSTEVVIEAKKSILWWKNKSTQKISVTVTSGQA